MAKSRNDILFRFVSDTKSLERGGRKAQQSMSKTTKAMGFATKAAGAFGLAVGGREILQQMGAAIGAASDYEESVNAVEVSVGSAASEVFALGETSAEALGLAKTEVNEAAVAFAAFGEKINANDVGGTFETFIGRATDFASVMNLDVNDALQKFQSGLAGESEPLRRFGIDVSAASVELFALETGLIKSGESMDEATKVQARYGLIMKQTTKFAGDFENTADSTANTQKILNARLADFQVELGKAIKGPMDDFLKILMKTTGESESLTDGLGNLIDGIRDAGKEFADADEGGVSGFIDKLKVLRETSSDVVTGQLKLIPFIGDDVAGAFTRVETAVGLAGDEFEELPVKIVGAGLAMGKLPENMRAGTESLLAAAGAAVAAGEGLIDLDEIVGRLKFGEVSLFDIGGSQAKTQGEIDAAIRRNAARGGGVQEGFHTGGVVGGRRGSLQPILAKGGERVSTANGSGGGGNTINITVEAGISDPVAVAERIQDLLELYGRTNGTF